MDSSCQVRTCFHVFSRVLTSGSETNLFLIYCSLATEEESRLTCLFIKANPCKDESLFFANLSFGFSHLLLLNRGFSDRQERLDDYQE